MLANPSEVTVGDVFTLTLQIIHPSDSRATPGQLENQWGPFEIRSLQPMDTVPLENSSGSISIQNIQATLWQTGTHTTPQLSIQVQDAAGTPTDVDVQPATVLVRSVLQTGDDALRDIRPQAALPFVPFWQQILIAAVVGLLLFGGLLWWWLRRRQLVEPEEEEEAEIVDLRPADVKALESIAAIADEHLPTQRRFAEHYDKLTDVLRRYLDDGFNIPALDMTTAELKHDLPADLLAPNEKSALFELLEEADWVKFAQVEPDFASADNLPERAREFVRATSTRLTSGDRTSGDLTSGDFTNERLTPEHPTPSNKQAEEARRLAAAPPDRNINAAKREGN